MGLLPTLGVRTRELIRATGYPEGHPDTNSGESDVDHLLEKQRSGAEFVITQLFYDVSKFVSWHKTCREKGEYDSLATPYSHLTELLLSGITVPILPGIMPIQTYQSFRRMAHLCRSCIPDKISQDLQAIENDDSAVKEYGCKLASAMMEQLYTQGINVFHVCTLNLEKSTRRVLQDLGWAPSSAAKAAKENGDAKNGVTESNQTSKRANVPRKGSVVHWDDYPNGRFGDPRSPAYGDQSGWGSRLKIPVRPCTRCRPESTSLTGTTGAVCIEAVGPPGRAGRHRGGLYQIHRGQDYRQPLV